VPRPSLEAIVRSPQAKPISGSAKPPFDVADPCRPSAFTYHRNLRQARQYVMDHLDGDLSLGAVARVAGVERKYFSMLFRRQAGVGFKTWTLLMRLNRAMALFRTTDATVTVVSELVGFQSLRTFERAFVRLVGLTPREYQQWARDHLDHAGEPPQGSEQLSHRSR